MKRDFVSPYQPTPFEATRGRLSCFYAIEFDRLLASLDKDQERVLEEILRKLVNDIDPISW